MAQREARIILGKVSRGTDPAVERARVARTMTVADLAERFLSLLDAIRSTRYTDEARRAVTRDVLPKIGRLDVVPILDVGQVNDDAQEQAEGVDCT